MSTSSPSSIDMSFTPPPFLAEAVRDRDYVGESAAFVEEVGATPRDIVIAHSRGESFDTDLLSRAYFLDAWDVHLFTEVISDGQA